MSERSGPPTLRGDDASSRLDACSASSSQGDPKAARQSSADDLPQALQRLLGDRGMLRARDYLKMKWQTFSYNFGWSKYVDLLDGTIPRLSYAVPIVGYLILFNDGIARNLTFLELTSGHSAIGLSGSARLKMLYLGLVVLGLANILYRWQRPYVLRLARNQTDYVDAGLKNFTINTFVELQGSIRHSSFGHYTVYGKYDPVEWERFLHHALGANDGGPNSVRKDSTGHWVEAKARYEHLLRSILIETFFRETTRTRRGWLVACLLIAGLGYVMLAVPSADLFLKVMISIAQPWLPGEP